MTVRVVPADVHPMYRYGLTATLTQSDSVGVIATADSGQRLLDAVEVHHPDVVITDLSMPDLDGVAATRALRALDPAPGVLVLTVHEDDEHVFAALRASAGGYHVKGADGDEIIRAVSAVAHGDAMYGRSVARRIVSFFAGGADQSPAERASPELRPREGEVLVLVATGCRNHEVARRLGMSEKTVRNHVSQVLLKLQVPDRTSAALKAREAGIPGDWSRGPTVPRKPCSRPARSG